MKKQIGVIFGAKSDEYEVSLHSAENVLKALDSEKYDVIKIGITREGRWYVTDACAKQVGDDSWLTLNNRQCSIPHDPTVKGILVYDDNDAATVQHIDCFFPILHGDHGEDGEIQGLMSLAEIPFVGSGVKASANCMDKTAAKQIARLTGIRMAKDAVVRKLDYKQDKEGELARVCAVHRNSYPLFVKPSSAGSSVGVSKVHCYEELAGAIENALKFDHKVLVEEAIVGREIEVAVLGNEEPVASGVGEISSAGEFYDYESKYVTAEIQTSFVTDLPKKEIDRIRNYACSIYKQLDCRGLSRVDFFYVEPEENSGAKCDGSRGPAEGTVVFNEINTLPGFTNISMYPMLWKHEGLDTPELVDRLIELALEEHSEWI